MKRDPQIVMLAAGVVDSCNQLVISRDDEPLPNCEEATITAYQKKFKARVAGSLVILGRKAYEVFGDFLSECSEVMVVTSRSYIEGVTVCPTLTSAVALARLNCRDTGGVAYIIGGASSFHQTLKEQLADEIELVALYKTDLVHCDSGDKAIPGRLLERYYTRVKVAEIEDPCGHTTQWVPLLPR